MQEEVLSLEVFGCRIEFGWGSLSKLGEHAKKLGGKKALIVTDQGVSLLGLPNRISETLRDEDIGSIVFKEVSSDPTDVDVETGINSYKEEKCDLIIGLGGGSPLDAAKGIRVLASHEKPIRQYLGAEGVGKIVYPMPPLILIPTTSGTGAEVSKAGILIDSERRAKRPLRLGAPSLAVCDPELTLGMPPKLTASTGMDALSHNIEAFLSPKFHPFAEGIALEGIRLVAENLLPAAEDGQNRKARINMAMASTIGGLAFQKGLGVTHSLAHPLSARYGLHHGIANAILLPYAMEFNKDATGEKLTRIAYALGEVRPSPEAAIKAVAQLTQRLGLPMKLSVVNVPQEGILALAQDAMKDLCHLNNPRPCNESQMAMLYQKAF